MNPNFTQNKTETKLKTILFCIYFIWITIEKFWVSQLWLPYFWQPPSFLRMLEPTLLWALMVHAIIKLQGEEGRVVSVSSEAALEAHSLADISADVEFQWTERGDSRKGAQSERDAFLHMPVSAAVWARRGQRVRGARVLFQSASIWGMQAGVSWDAVNGASFSTRDKQEEVHTAGTKRETPRMNGNPSAACAGNNCPPQISGWGKTHHATLCEAWLACKVRWRSERRPGCMPDRPISMLMRFGGEVGEIAIFVPGCLCAAGALLWRGDVCAACSRVPSWARRQKSRCQCT